MPTLAISEGKMIKETYNMIEKINTAGYKTISKPSKNVIKYLEKFLKDAEEPISIAEIGIGVGATSIEIVKRLRKKDSFYFFSYENDVRELESDLKNQDYCNCKLYPMGNTRAVYDSYNWKLSSLYLEDNELFDLVYLDGAHSFFHDGLATVLLKKLVKQNGIIIFDDVHWSYQKSPTRNPEKHPRTLKEYSMEQIKTEQVKRVIEVFMEPDKDWERIGDITDQAIYRKK